MRRELIIKTRSLAGASDLTLLAPIKRGLVPSLESITYKSRVKRLLRTLTSLRTSSHEFALLRPLSDAVERVGRIHSVRVAVMEPEDKVLLAVTFDGAWESYIRVLWQKVGGLLDVVFCNTEGYVSACDHSFDEYLAWARRIQRESAFFYAAPHTVDDIAYLRREELLHRMTDDALDVTHRTNDRDLLATRLHVQGAEGDAAAQRKDKAQIGEALSQGMLALGAFYRLADVFLPSEDDGKHLQRAARELLAEFRGILAQSPDTLNGLREKFGPPIEWLLALDGAATARQATPVLEPIEYNRSNVQGGIVTAYEGVTHGCLMLMSFDDAAAGARFLEKIIPCVTCDGTQPTKDQPIVTNVAVTHEGLRALGLNESQLEYFSQGFREGMELRAGLLGDVRTNHPRRWRLPTRVYAGAARAPVPIELSAVHCLVQLRVRASMDNECDDPLEAAHPLYERVQQIGAFDASARLLAVESMRRRFEPIGGKARGKEKVREHFGFLDGEGQPVIGPQDGKPIFENGVHLGEILLGYSNEADPAPTPASDPAECDRRELLFDGSFLVVRKLRQDVKELHAKAAAAARTSELTKELVLAKLMGRELDGKPLVRNVGSGVNDFDFRSDPDGSECPLHAHIRRANPRERLEPGGRRPRIMRRGMSYGPRYDHDNPANPVNARERGLMFMAYNSSIEEQFEVVQRWLTGGNSTGGLSMQSDPLLGVPENGQQRFYRFEHQGKVVRMELDGSPAPLADRKPFVRLEWGMYLFTPSLRALRKLKEIAAASQSAAPVWTVADGERQIAALRAIEAAGDQNAAIEAWKSALEDPDSVEDFASASIWAAIRARHGGALRTPYGVLVADRNLVMHVFTDPFGHYSAKGYHQRMARSIGPIYLGLDRQTDGRYEAESAVTNAAIGKLEEEPAFALAFTLTSDMLKEMIEAEKQTAAKAGASHWTFSLDVKQISDVVLAKLCQYWFGIPENGSVFPVGSARWNWTPDEPSPCPGNFTPPSRYIFQPRPSDTVEKCGTAYGLALTEQMQGFIAQYCKDRRVPPAPDGAPAPIVADILAAHWENELTVTQVAQNLVGAMMGFLPTVDGNLRRSLNEWLNDHTFWCLRARWTKAQGGSEYAKANDLLRPALMRSMQLRPSPELVWRTVACHHTLGPVPVVAGDLVVLSIVSATQQCLQQQIEDVSPIFGGDRSLPEHPTHACPGYEPAMGTLLGIIAALLDVPESIRPTPAPLVLQFSGSVNTPNGS